MKIPAMKLTPTMKRSIVEAHIPHYGISLSSLDERLCRWRDKKNPIKDKEELIRILDRLIRDKQIVELHSVVTSGSSIYHEYYIFPADVMFDFRGYCEGF